MTRNLFFWMLLGFSVGAWAQQQSSTPPNQSPTSSPQTSSQAPNASSSSAPKPVKPHAPDFSPPRSDRINAGDLGNDIGESSSKDTQIDLSPPEDDARKHPQSSEAMAEAEAEATGVREFHIWDPHKAAKSVEVGDFYFKRKNYRAAEDRYREALGYKDNDAIATFRLAVCLEKLDRPEDALAEYESYLKILPYGADAADAHKAIDRLKSPAADTKPAK